MNSQFQSKTLNDKCQCGDVCYAYSLKSDASCLSRAPRAPTQCQTCADMLIDVVSSGGACRDGFQKTCQPAAPTRSHRTRRRERKTITARRLRSDFFNSGYQTSTPLVPRLAAKCQCVPTNEEDLLAVIFNHAAASLSSSL